MKDIIKEAVKAAGGPLKVAHDMGFTNQRTVEKWIKTGRVPAWHVTRLCELGGNKITPEQIRSEASAAA
jgi:hypothetical protein